MKILYRRHDNKSMRVWLDSWSGDTFEIYDIVDFRDLQELIRPLIQMEEADDE